MLRKLDKQTDSRLLFVYMKIRAIFLLTGALLVNSCSTTAVWDSSFPPEQTASLQFHGVFIKEYNGIAVQWKPAVLGGLEILIPAGESEFLADIDSGSFTARDAVFKQTFEAGKRYSLLAGYNRSVGTTGMTIKDEEGEVRFAPFKRR